MRWRNRGQPPTSWRRSGRTGHCAASKGEAVRLFREQIGDVWAAFVSEVYATGKDMWGYLIPEDDEQRRHLRALRGRALAFENYHLSVCRNYLLSQLQSTASDEMERGMRLLKRLTYLDANMQPCRPASEQSTR